MHWVYAASPIVLDPSTLEVWCRQYHRTDCLYFSRKFPCAHFRRGWTGRPVSDKSSFWKDSSTLNLEPTSGMLAIVTLRFPYSACIPIKDTGYCTVNTRACQSPVHNGILDANHFALIFARSIPLKNNSKLLNLLLPRKSQVKLVAYPYTLQDVEINPNFCWLMVLLGTWYIQQVFTNLGQDSAIVSVTLLDP